MTISSKPMSSRMPTCFAALSTIAAGVGLPNCLRNSFSTEPLFTPMRIGVPRSLAIATMRSTRLRWLMLPGLRRILSTPASRARIAMRESKWMSAISGTLISRLRIGRALALFSKGTATRIISTPASSSSRISARVASMSSVRVVHIDWTMIGLSPPIFSEPICTSRLFLRSTVSKAVLRDAGWIR
jgi:hypothetical protein